MASRDEIAHLLKEAAASMKSDVRGAVGKAAPWRARASCHPRRAGGGSSSRRRFLRSERGPRDRRSMPRARSRSRRAGGPGDRPTASSGARCAAFPRGAARRSRRRRRGELVAVAREVQLDEREAVGGERATAQLDEVDGLRAEVRILVVEGEELLLVVELCAAAQLALRRDDPREVALDVLCGEFPVERARELRALVGERRHEREPRVDRVVLGVAILEILGELLRVGLGRVERERDAGRDLGALRREERGELEERARRRGLLRRGLLRRGLLRRGLLRRSLLRRGLLRRRLLRRRLRAALGHVALPELLADQLLELGLRGLRALQFLRLHLAVGADAPEVDGERVARDRAFPEFVVLRVLALEANHRAMEPDRRAAHNRRLFDAGAGLGHDGALLLADLGLRGVRSRRRSRRVLRVEPPGPEWLAKIVGA